MPGYGFPFPPLLSSMRAKPFFRHCCSSSSSSSSNHTTTRISLFHPSILPLQSCKSLRQLKQAHAHFIVTGLARDSFAVSRLLKSCSASNSSSCVAYAVEILRWTDSPDTFSYNIVIKGMSSTHSPEKAVVFYFVMVESGIPPNSYTFPPLVNACARARVVELGKKVHGQAVKNGVDDVVFVQNAFVHMYCCLGAMGCARKVFNGMSYRDCVTWNSLLHGYVKSCDADTARQVFDEMPEKNAVSWNSMIDLYLRACRPGNAMKLFREMQLRQVESTATTMVSMLTACTRSNRLLEGRSVHAHMIRKCIKVSTIVGAALVDMYGKRGSIDTARRLFERMRVRNVVTWNCLLMAHALRGDAQDVMILFEDMRDSGKHLVVPDEVTFIAVLLACMRKGLVTEARQYFSMMRQEYHIEPTFAHYWCLANLYAGGGMHREAEEILVSMPLEPKSLVWVGLLCKCRFHGDLELGEKIAKRLIELEPCSSSGYSLLVIIYSVVGRWEDVEKVKETVRERGLKCFPGHSLVDLNGLVHEFEPNFELEIQFEHLQEQARTG